MVVKPLHAIVVPRMADNVWIRVANMNTMLETLQKGEYMATLYPDMCIKQSRRDSSQQEVERYTIGAELSKQQKVKLKNLLQEYKEVMWTPGQKLPVVNMGVENSIRLKPTSLPK